MFTQPLPETLCPCPTPEKPNPYFRETITPVTQVRQCLRPLLFNMSQKYFCLTPPTGCPQ